MSLPQRHYVVSKNTEVGHADIETAHWSYTLTLRQREGDRREKEGVRENERGENGK